MFTSGPLRKLALREGTEIWSLLFGDMAWGGPLAGDGV